MYQGLLSLSRLRNSLTHAPKLPGKTSCGPNHANECVVAWRVRWEVMLDEAKRAGNRLDDPGKLLEVFLKSVTTHPVRSLTGKSKLPPIPCSPTFKSLLKLTKEKLDDGIADYFMIP
ncbi:hypothetical protein P691DRAFT_113342 [Macrolepiota fuliginosa MF-IS2]|uniref:Uncharacterized protein n=1 Tax=Macrolepiota fuliginosa MF-IS2 TaxID=1400762 RepID=A0A9P6BWH3_9AGAR|nr:hypothetical protein P691DRAFT_113342 [Macrolepiota fuliginosa MF-IS2]